MMWHRDYPGDAPPPDPARAAEDHFYQQSLTEPPDPPDVCQDCHDRGWYVARDPRPDCETCHGDGVYLGHAESCVSDDCTLNADIFSCAGEMQPCECTTVNCDPCTVREYNAEVARQRVLLIDADNDPEVPF